MTKRPPYVHLDQWYLRAVALYGRLTATEWQCMTVAWEHIAGWSGRDRAAIAQSAFHELTCAGEESVRRSVRALATPAGEEYRWGSKPTMARMGHGMLVVERPPTNRGRETVYSLQLDWHRWGWDDKADLELVASVLARYRQQATVDASEAAERLARSLRTHITVLVGDAADVPIDQPSCRAWNRWCGTFQRLLDRDWHEQAIGTVINHLAEDEHWQTRIVGPHADRVFYDNFDAIYIRTTQAFKRRRQRGGYR